MAKQLKAKASTTKKKPPPNAQDLLKLDHFRRVRGLFHLAGFGRLRKLVDQEFTFKGSTCDFDDVFFYENVIVLLEYTVKKDDVSAHLKKKKVVFDKICDNSGEFIKFMSDTFPAFSGALNELYDESQYRVVVVYASRYAISSVTKAEVPDVKYLDYNVVRYLESVSRTVRKSGRFEIFEFLGLPSTEVGDNVLSSLSDPTNTYHGSVLPESHSNFGQGYKVVSCYIDPDALLRRAYVLRRDGWRAGANLYQRMISKTKIESIRRYLRQRQRVFINNIIVTLPYNTKIVDGKGNTIDVSTISKTQPARVQIPNSYSCVGIIDGQHRLFSYYEGGNHETEIGKLRKRQNLLVTGIIFPESITDDERARFEANLFLEINSTQTNAKSDLKQEIELMLRPFSAEAIAKRVINHLNDENGPLCDVFERYFYDVDKMKTTSVVSYGLRLFVRPESEDSIFRRWQNSDKNEILEGKNDALLAEYVQFCTSEINKFMSAVRKRIPPDRWTADRKIANRFLTTTSVNGCINCLRRIAKDDKLQSHQKYAESLVGIEDFDFSTYKSSQYNKLGERLYEEFF